MMLTLKVSSPEIAFLLGQAEAVHNAAGKTLLGADGEPGRAPRGLRPVRASHDDAVVTRETRPQAETRTPQPQSSPNSECAGICGRESEASVVAEKPGNSGGAKGCRRGTAGW
jgi:hypothetical protein